MMCEGIRFVDEGRRARAKPILLAAAAEGRIVGIESAAAYVHFNKTGGPV